MCGRLRRWLAACAGVLAVAGLASAASWGGIVPGETTRRELEAQYGRPTRERVLTEEGQTASEWTYTGNRAPRGLDRMVVSFGLMRAGGFVPDVVRALTLYPKPRIFTVGIIVEGWGAPDATGTEQQTGRRVYRYDSKALVVQLDPTGQWAEVLLFAPDPKP
jgi:hypothetical protein